MVSTFLQNLKVAMVNRPSRHGQWCGYCVKVLKIVSSLLHGYAPFGLLVKCGVATLRIWKWVIESGRDRYR